MEPSGILQIDRRHVFTMIPGCALLLLGCKGASAKRKRTAASPRKHVFEEEYQKRLTYKQLFAMQYREYILLTKNLARDLGEQKLLELIKKYTDARMLKIGKMQASKAKTNDLKTYVAPFANLQKYKNALVMNIIEHTDRAFEIRVSECIWATTFLEAKAGPIGHASICYGDYAWARGFNPKIALIRSKILMQGDTCCNHRYILKG